MSQPTVWDRVKTGGKSGFDKTWKAMDKLGAPVNKLSNKLGSEAFWPTTLDKESDKAARILKTFCKDGFYAEEDIQPEDGPKQKQKIVKKIPTNVIKNAKGLAIFTTMRTGLWVSGAGGSGILIARKEDGSWSPPSGILLHTAGLGFLVGVDIYDCVIVINTAEALEAFTKIRCTLGSEISVAAGPVGAGGILESEVHARQAAIFTYLKSRGFYAGVQIDGTVIIERSDENERFYGQRIPVKEILEGKVRHPPYEVRRLLETIKAAQGDTDVDDTLIPTEAPPSDYVIEDGHVFGIPEKDDPDPYGVLALEKEGMSIKEAGTQKRASWEAFSFNPSPTSPIHNVYARTSTDRRESVSRRSSWRMSAQTPSSLRNSMDFPPPPPTPRTRKRQSLMVDSATQTADDLPEPASPNRWSMHQHSSSRSSFANVQMQEVPENGVLDTSPERREAEVKSEFNGYTTPPRTPTLEEDKPHEHDEEEAHIEEPVVHSVQTVQPASPQVISKARLVTVPKRVPPKLPPRNPNRSGPMIIDASSPTGISAEEAAAVEGAKHDDFANEPATSEKDIAAVIEPIDATKHDSAHEDTTAQKEDFDDDAVERKMDDVRLDDDDDDEVMKSNPWAKVEETRQREAERTSTIPGGFIE